MHKTMTLAALTAFCVAGVASADTPFWDRDPVGTGGAGGTESRSLFPVEVVRDVAPARAEATRLSELARAAAAEADARQQIIFGRGEADVTEARRALREASSRVQALRAEVLAALSDDADYTASRQLARQLRERIDALHASAGDNGDEIVRLSREALYYASRASAAERAALADDTGHADAREAFERATGALRDAVAARDASVAQDGELATLRETATRLRAEAAAAEAFARAASHAADVAVRFTRDEIAVRFGPTRGYGFRGYDRYHRGGVYGFGAIRVPVVGFGVPRFGPVVPAESAEPAVTNVQRNVGPDGRPIISNSATNR